MGEALKKALFLLFPLLLISATMPLIGAPPTTETFAIHQVQLQCRRWDPPGWRYWYWNYDSELEIRKTGNAIHTEISYQPYVSEEEGTSMTWVYNKHEDRWILHEGTVKYISPYSGLWIEEHWRGYIEFDEQGNFDHGVTYQWGYTYCDDPPSYYPYAIWDDVVGAWLLGFSVYIWDRDTFDQYVYFTGGPPQDGAFHSYTTSNPLYPPAQAYSIIEPVPASDYNPWGL